MLTVYHATFTRSVRVIWLLEELGVPYQVEKLEFDSEERRTGSYVSVNPFAKLPALIDGDHTLYESLAIMQWILEKHGEGRLRPAPATVDSARFLQWLQFSEGIAFGPLGQVVQHSFSLPEELRSAELLARAHEALHKVYQVVEEQLADQEYLLASGFTAADVAFGYNLLLGQALRAFPEESFPVLAAYWGRLKARPACQAALAK